MLVRWSAALLDELKSMGFFLKLCLQVVFSCTRTWTRTMFVQVKWDFPEQAPVVPAIRTNPGPVGLFLLEGNSQLEMGKLVPAGVWVKLEIARSSWLPPRVLT